MKVTKVITDNPFEHIEIGCDLGRFWISKRTSGDKVSTTILNLKEAEAVKDFIGENL